MLLGKIHGHGRGMFSVDVNFQHIKEPFHRKFAKSSKNYSALDELISSSFKRILLDPSQTASQEISSQDYLSSAILAPLSLSEPANQKVPRSLRRTLYPADYNLVYSSIESSYSEHDPENTSLLRSPHVDSIFNLSSPIAKRFNITKVTLKSPNDGKSKMLQGSMAANPGSFPAPQPLQLHAINARCPEEFPHHPFSFASIGNSPAPAKGNLDPQAEKLFPSQHRALHGTPNSSNKENVDIERVSTIEKQLSSECPLKLKDSHSASPSSPICASKKRICKAASPLSVLTKKALKNTAGQSNSNENFSIGKRNLRTSTLCNTVESKYRKGDAICHGDKNDGKSSDLKSKRILLFPM